MKFTNILTMAAALGSIGAEAGKKKSKPVKNCELTCGWGGWNCNKSPWNYDCDENGRFTYDERRFSCEDNCRCKWTLNMSF
ncbi:hypothetical protein B0T11DRAFT_343316 [Plectosphaerella cucumerina]|uniref:Uncharacterized protein n=1 Tax=Plectosphaerella cucumerina TaxID=40658 RepID=A0A8K0T6Y5_9PEZI|nr:hypothetical protein B0T11DRAFT_343316 [Plectosphaerella cucumerina]